MVNFLEAVRHNPNPSIDRLEIGDFLFARYTCGVGDEKLGLFAPTDYLVNVMTGRKTWHTADGVWAANRGDTLFFKKGAAIVDQHFEVEFCLVVCFLPDHVVKATVREIAGSLGAPADAAPIRTAARVENDVALSAFFQSMQTYFAGHEKPSEPLLRLKVKELIVSLLTSGKNPGLSAYFRTLAERDGPSVPETMETNFRFNLSLEEYAKLCHRSLSSFKREFQAHFQESPGKWLLHKRVDYAAALLRGSKMNVTEIAFESGFEDVSHFSRVFKQRFRTSPLAYRQDIPAT